MISRLWLLVCACCFATGAFAQQGSGVTPAPAAWTTSYESAISRASAAGKPVALLFVHEGCPECNRMDYYLQSPQSRQALRNAYKVRVEFTQNPGLVQQFGVTHTPTFIVLSRGGEAYREVGAIPPDRMAGIGRSIDSMVSQPRPAARKARSSTSKPSGKSSSKR